MIEKEVLLKLRKKGLTNAEIAEEVGVKPSTVQRYMTKYDIYECRPWTDEEDQYLMKSVGIMPKNYISRKLDRTIQAIGHRMMILGITLFDAQDTLTASELARCLKVHPSTIIRSWIKKYNLQAQHKVIGAGKKKNWLINIQNFWDWAKENRKRIDFSRLEKNLLGPEPDWVDKARINPRVFFHDWTYTDALLTHYWNMGMGRTEIAKKLGLERSRVSSKIQAIGLRRGKIDIPWKSVEEDMLLEMKKSGTKEKEIAEELGRDYTSVKSKIYRMRKKGISI